MGRRVIKPERGQLVDSRSDAARQLALELGPQKGKKKPKKKKAAKRNPGTPFEIKRALDEIIRRLEEEDWDGMRPGLLVALFHWCHEQTYGVPPSNLKGETWRNAQRSAGLMVKNEFAGDIQEALAFMRWTWQRERRIEQWRRDNNKPGKVIHWYDQFVKAELLTKYRVDQARGRTN